MSNQPHPAAPLTGYRVLDLTNVLAGPFCCNQLAHLGADVIKVEVPGRGDLARQLGADPERNARGMGISFLAQNPGKRSVTINLKAEAGREVFCRLVRTADVLVENFRPGVMDRLGVGYARLQEENADLVYCAISGFGQDGPLRDFPAYDQIIQGMSGIMSITGAPDTAPYRVGYPVADTIGGLTAAFAITAALAKPKGSRGTLIDVSILESVLATMGWVVSNYLIGGRGPQPLANDNFTASPSGTFRTGDGLMNLAANKQEQFEALCQLVGRPELATDARFVTRQDRLDNRTELQAELEQAFASNSTEHWIEQLNKVGVPAGPVLTVPEALAHPQVVGRDLFDSLVDSDCDSPLRVIRGGMRYDEVRPSVTAPPPQLGQHTDEVLDELGYSADEINRLREGDSI